MCDHRSETHWQYICKILFFVSIIAKALSYIKKMRKKKRKENVKKSQMAINSLTNKLPSGSPICNTSVQPLHLYLFLCLENTYKWMNVRVVYTICFFFVFLQLAFFLRRRYLIAIRAVSIITILINDIWVELFRQVLHWDKNRSFRLSVFNTRYLISLSRFMFQDT